MKSADGHPSPVVCEPKTGQRSEAKPAGRAAVAALELGLDVRPQPADFTLWQLADSAFPTGGFAHSAGLEAAWQHGEVRNRLALTGFIDSSLRQLGRAALPYVTESHTLPHKLKEFDEHCEAFTSNHVANRASRAQGRAFLVAVDRIFLRSESTPFPAKEAANLAIISSAEVPYAHFAPVFGASLRSLSVSLDQTQRLFIFGHLRGLVAAAVRLNIVGPMEAQSIQHQVTTRAETLRCSCKSLRLDDLAQVAPLLDLWQGAQDRLYSRLFQS